MNDKKEIFKNIANLVSLLGGKKEIIELIRGIENLESVDDSVNEKIFNYNYELTTTVKDRLANMIGTQVITNK